MQTKEPKNRERAKPKDARNDMVYRVEPESGLVQGHNDRHCVYNMLHGRDYLAFSSPSLSSSPLQLSRIIYPLCNIFEYNIRLVVSRGLIYILMHLSENAVTEGGSMCRLL